MILDIPYRYRVFDVHSDKADFLCYLEYEDTVQGICIVPHPIDNTFLNVKGKWQDFPYRFPSKADALNAIRGYLS